MSYLLRWDDAALDDLRSLGKAEGLRIVRKIETHLLKNPLSIGKPLGGNLKGYYKYRIGDYRVVYRIVRDELLVVVVRVGHRKEVYNR